MVPNDRYFKKIRLKELEEGLDKLTEQFISRHSTHNNEIGAHR